MTLVVDTGLLELTMMSEKPRTRLLLVSMLPPRYKDQYDAVSLKRFFLALVSAAERIRKSEQPRSVAEEMALAAIFDQAVMPAQEPAYADVVEELVEGLRDFQEHLLPTCTNC